MIHVYLAAGQVAMPVGSTDIDNKLDWKLYSYRQFGKFDAGGRRL